MLLIRPIFVDTITGKETFYNSEINSLECRLVVETLRKHFQKFKLDTLKADGTWNPTISIEESEETGLFNINLAASSENINILLNIYVYAHEHSYLKFMII